MLPRMGDDVSPAWVHPDLHRHRAERQRGAALQRVAALEQRSVWLQSEEQALDAAVSTRQLRYEQLVAAAAEAKRALEATTQVRTTVHTLHEQATNQLHYHKSMLCAPAALLSLAPPAPTPAEEAEMLCDGSHKGDGNDTGDEGTRRDAVTVCSVGLLLLPTLLSCTAAEPHCTGRNNNSSSNSSSGSDNSADATAQRFLRLYAPLFDWDAQQRCVVAPFFFDEPCLLEAEQATTATAATGASTTSVCSNDGCAYWHRDQHQHMRRVLARLLCRLRTRCVRDERVCAVADAVAALARHVRCAATSLELLCGAAAATLTAIIAREWHVHMLACEARSGHGVWPAPVLLLASSTTTTAAAAATTTQTSASRIASRLRDVHECAAWRAVVARAAATHTSLAAAASEAFQRTSDAVSWRVLLRSAAAAAEPMTPTQRRWAAARGVALYASSPHAHVHHILEYAAAVAADTVRADTVRAQAASCVQACLHSAQVLSAQVAAATTLVAATTAAASLPPPQAQQHQQQHEQQPSLHSMSGSASYAATTMRYVAYMLVRCAVTLATADAHAAVALLTRAVDDGLRGTLALLPLAIANLSMLLVALRHAAAMDSSEEAQVEGSMDSNSSTPCHCRRRAAAAVDAVVVDVLALPLGAVSDVAFTLCCVAPLVRPHDVCGRQLNALLELVAAYERGNKEGNNATTAATSLRHGQQQQQQQPMTTPLPSPLQHVKAAAQLSLMRAYAGAGTRYVEQILKKLSMSSAVAQGVLWCEYVHCVAETDGVPASRHLVEALLMQLQQQEELASEPVTDGNGAHGCGATDALSCVLTLLCVWQLDMHGRSVSDGTGNDTMATMHVRRCCRRVLQQQLGCVGADCDDAVSVHAVTQQLLTTHCLCRLPAVERAALCVLLSRLLSPPRERLAWLQALPHAIVTGDDVDAVVLLLVAEVRVAAALRDVAAFTRSVTRHGRVLREMHLLWWSALDVWHDEVVGVPHAVLLFVYKLVPALFGADATAATVVQWREALLCCAARLGVLHPLLRDEACVAPEGDDGSDA